MRTMKTVDVPATTRQELDRVTCDFCAVEITKPRREYDFDEVKIERSHGAIYPDDTWSTTIALDCCPACWDAKVLPALRALLVPGAEPRTEERSGF